MNLREARFKSGFTQWDVGLKTRIHQSKISLFERGYLVPRADEKKRIAKALGLRTDDLDW